MLREDRPRTIKTQTDVSGRRGGDVAVGPHQIYQTTTGRQREQAAARTFPRGIKAGGMCASARFQSPGSKATLYRTRAVRGSIWSSRELLSGLGPLEWITYKSRPSGLTAMRLTRTDGAIWPTRPVDGWITYTPSRAVSGQARRRSTLNPNASARKSRSGAPASMSKTGSLQAPWRSGRMIDLACCNSLFSGFTLHSWPVPGAP